MSGSIISQNQIQKVNVFDYYFKAPIVFKAIVKDKVI